VNPKDHEEQGGSIPSPETKTIQVQGHNRGSTQIHSHLRKINTKAHGNKKETKATKSKKKTAKPKHSAFHNGLDDCSIGQDIAHPGTQESY
jgi:hypothetical protein